MHFSQNSGIMETDYMGKQGIVMPKKILIVEDEANIRACTSSARATP